VLLLTIINCVPDAKTKLQGRRIINMKIFWIDLFAGGGGTTTGIHMADANATVVACVNHDPIAIETHRANHPETKHFTEDIRDFEVVKKLKVIVDNLRKLHPGCMINIWASLECTNYSKAKGGQPRDADSRTLAWDLIMYIEELNPDYLYIENVREFMAWGKLDKNGRPIHMHKGCDYLFWVRSVQHKGFDYDWRMLNAADFGAYTSRDRYFGIFAKSGLPIAWPEPTHAKQSQKADMFTDGLKKWKPVREVLDLQDEGVSIFERKKPLVDATLERIYAGLVKFVANGDDTFIKKYFSGRPAGKVISVDGPAGTIKTSDGQALVKAKFMLKYNSMNKNGKHNPPGIDEPSPVVATQNRLGIVHTNFLSTYYGNGGVHSIENPSPTLTTKDRITKISSLFIDQQYGNGQPISTEKPSPTITSIPKQNLTFILNPSWGGNHNSVDAPSPVIVARQDKAPLYIIAIDHGAVALPVYESDSPAMIKIKQFMAVAAIMDIKMRMLKIDELKRIQGFPEDYQLMGNQTQQKKQIGNAVVPLVAQRLVEANADALNEITFELTQQTQ
jgi:DNA (cytosine-5)-methyltransferase 1